MKNPELYHKSLNVLVKAFINDTLEHGNCTACAVGNLVADALRIDLKKEYTRFEGLGDPSRDLGLWYDALQQPKPTQKMLQQIKYTGYDIEELRKIEKAFESSDLGETEEDEMYNGLMAVVETLGEIHEVSKEQVQESKLLFVKP
jgi:hypothetical protein